MGLASSGSWLAFYMLNGVPDFGNGKEKGLKLSSEKFVKTLPSQVVSGKLQFITAAAIIFGLLFISLSILVAVARTA